MWIPLFGRTVGQVVGQGVELARGDVWVSGQVVARVEDEVQLTAINIGGDDQSRVDHTQLGDESEHRPHSDYMAGQQQRHIEQSCQHRC